MTPFLVFWVPNAPVAKGRPRVTARGGFARTYTPKKTRIYENWVRDCALKAFEQQSSVAIEGPLALHLIFTIAKAKGRKKAEVHPAHKPDLDNLVKSVLDGINLAELWVDDSQVVDLVASKVYGPQPGCMVAIGRPAWNGDARALAAPPRLHPGLDEGWPTGKAHRLAAENRGHGSRQDPC